MLCTTQVVPFHSMYSTNKHTFNLIIYIYIRGQVLGNYIQHPSANHRRIEEEKWQLCCLWPWCYPQHFSWGAPTWRWLIMGMLQQESYMWVVKYCARTASRATRNGLMAPIPSKVSIDIYFSFIPVPFNDVIYYSI